MIIQIATISILMVIFMAVWQYKSNKNSFNKAMVSISKIYDTLGDAITKTSASRALILYTSNGGGIPHPGSTLYSTVLYEYHDANIKAVKNEFQSVLVDGEYVDMLVQLEQHGAIFRSTSEMRPGLLRSIYERDGVTAVYIFKIHSTDLCYYYGSISTTDPLGVIDLATIELAANKLRVLFKENIKI